MIIFDIAQHYHYQPELIRYARENAVILVCLSLHTTHETQTLDASVIRSLKQNWNDECHQFFQKNPGRVITKFDFSALLNLAWGKTMVPNVICSGFKQSGIYPFNPQAIDYGVVTKKSTAQENSKAMDLSHEQVQHFERR